MTATHVWQICHIIKEECKEGNIFVVLIKTHLLYSGKQEMSVIGFTKTIFHSIYDSYEAKET